MEGEVEGPTLEMKCDGCGRSIDQPEVRIGERVYCCETCAAGEGCDCPDLSGKQEGRPLQPLWSDLARR
jgi:hypothetical protein